MADFMKFLPYLAVMAIVTYLVRMLPLVLVRKKIKSNFIRSFLYYVPYAVLGVMTFPAVFYSTGSAVSGIVGFAAALLMAYLEKSLITVASTACAAVFVTELVMKFI
ncbi:MAG: AzlD domain-containing protein [Clostridia bacterium]|nr:AzlD domain-containing protein [Clostridia bacterium]